VAFIVGLLVCGFDLPASAQQIGHTQIEVLVPQPPAPVGALGRSHLVYELHLTNLGASAGTLQQIDVLDGERTVIASWSGRALSQRLRIIGQVATAPGSTDTVPPGMRAVAHMWISLQPGARAPGVLMHRLTVADVSGESETITTAPLSLPPAAAAIASPVRGGPWVAVRGPSNGSGHRLSLVTLDGRTRVPQRFAVDWTRLGPDGLPFRGDRMDINNWHGYGLPVHAVAAGTVVLIRDGSPDGAPFGPAPPAVIQAAAAPGNVVVIDIGHGRLATYAHLKPGSFHVAMGERVAQGQVLARIGNSGNSLGPHLHFHVADAVEPLGGEGLPFTIESFELIGRLGSLPGLLGGRPWTPSPEQPARAVLAEMPLENMVVTFKEK
jgi:hypothetical protein